MYNSAILVFSYICGTITTVSFRTVSSPHKENFSYHIHPQPHLLPPVLSSHTNLLSVSIDFYIRDFHMKEVIYYVVFVSDFFYLP